MPRIAQVKTLHELLPKGAVGGKEFAHIIDLLLFHVAHEQAESLTLLNDAAGDYAGLDSFATRAVGTTGFQYKFFPSPFSAKHRTEIRAALVKAIAHKKESRLTRWVLVTPEDLTETSKRAGGDVTWWQSLRAQAAASDITIDHWGHKALQALFIKFPRICLYYYPELVPGGASARKELRDIRKKYDSNLNAKYRNIKFVGMSVYKPETARDIPMEHIYIPLQLITEHSDDNPDGLSRVNPSTILSNGGRHVILGDPGSGKSTLLRFLALAGQTRSLQERFKIEPAPARLPVLIVLRRYADALKSNIETSLLDHIIQSTQADFSLQSADSDFFHFYLESGRALLCFDGLDELPDSSFKEIVRDRIVALLETYPGNTCIVTSRIVGYDAEIRFPRDFAHHKLSKLSLPEIVQFVNDWYVAREPSKSDRDTSIQSLVQVIRDPDHESIRDLARNPLLLTIIALVHRIDAVLPDERVVLYQKCTETLLNTWHTWKYKDQADGVARSRVERWNRGRIEGIAYWMQQRSVGSGSMSRAIVTHAEVATYLEGHIRLESGHEPSFDAEVAADSFLRFVRSKAGLLVEVGDGQYSFVHMTFQEYLTSSHVLTISESGGAESLWRHIESVTGLDRWNETVRLLVASLRSDESKAVLIQHLLKQCEGLCTPERATLLLGLLVDRVEQAKVAAGPILRAFLRAAIGIRKFEDYARATSRVRSLLRRQPEYTTTVVSESRELCATMTSSEARRVGFAVLAVCSDAAAAFETQPQLHSDSWVAALMREPDPSLTTTSIVDMSIDLALMQPLTNIAAACAIGGSMASSPLHAANHAFRSLLASLLAEPAPGPFFDLARNIRMLWGFDHIVPAFVSNSVRHAPRSSWFNVFPRDRRGIGRQSSARLRSRRLLKSVELNELGPLSSALLSCLHDGEPARAWDAVLADRQVSKIVAELIVRGIGASRTAGWIEMLIHAALPAFRTRKFDSRQLDKIVKGTIAPGEEEIAGVVLLLGAAAHLYSGDEKPSFKKLAASASKSSNLSLRLAVLFFLAAAGNDAVAHQLRDILVGDGGAFAPVLGSVGWMPNGGRRDDSHHGSQPSADEGGRVAGPAST
ncbi:MAG: NACHT domain-containing protein [Labilithrix sp.]|nr:NACHT domain-containing protein [Labilithrix sp.]